MRRVASSHSLLRYEYTDPNLGYMLRCPLKNCHHGTLNPRNAKQAIKAHFREFHKDGMKYEIKVESKNGFNHLQFPCQEESIQKRQNPAGGKGNPSKKGGAQRPLYLQQEAEALARTIQRGCYSAAASSDKQKSGEESKPPLDRPTEQSRFQFTHREFADEARARRNREQDMYHSTFLD